MRSQSYDKEDFYPNGEFERIHVPVRADTERPHEGDGTRWMKLLVGSRVTSLQ